MLMQLGVVPGLGVPEVQWHPHLADLLILSELGGGQIMLILVPPDYRPSYGPILQRVQNMHFSVRIYYRF